MPCLDRFERFLYEPGTPVLIKAALAHVQFETIHPFLDGNGRVGRLLITFLLCAEDVLADPILYLSLYFKTHREEYYERLQRVRTHGEWEEWLRFFLEGVRETSAQAVQTAREILTLFEHDRGRIRESLGGRAGSTLRVHEVMQRRPLLTIKEAERRSGVSRPTAQKSLERMAQLGITREVTGSRYGMTCLYEPTWRSWSAGPSRSSRALAEGVGEPRARAARQSGAGAIRRAVNPPAEPGARWRVGTLPHTRSP